MISEYTEVEDPDDLSSGAEAEKYKMFASIGGEKSEVCVITENGLYYEEKNEYLDGNLLIEQVHEKIPNDMKAVASL